ncbi:hypothetical protein ABH926_007339 [Catenulispora sp. GP43]|uniref:hypothetical protein n=1 Tax=Catenulispora sp. GP43 TaxID=3156263 RepID=UPI003515E553
MTENSGRIRALLDDTLTGEPPLVDLVPDAVSGAERNQRRSRLMAGGAAVAVVAVTVGAYGLAGGNRDGSVGTGALAPTSGSSSASKPAALGHKSTLGIPGLFDNPGTPQEECAKVNGPVLDSKQKLSSPEARSWCIGALTQMRALMPDAVVVLNPNVDFDQLAWSAPLGKAPEGSTLPGFAHAYQQAVTDGSKTVYLATGFAFRNANGEGTAYFDTTPPGVKSKPQPGGDIPLGDGTFGHLTQNVLGQIEVSGVTAAGVWYELGIGGVGEVYGSDGVTTGSNPHSDGVGHGVFPDGYVTVGFSPENKNLPNPYTVTQVRDLIKAQGLGKLVNTIGANPLSDYPAPT